MAMRVRPCLRCKAIIPLERLEVIPETRLCVKCSQEVGGDFETKLVRESLGKAGSLKKNYGGVSVIKRRRRIQPLE